MQDQFTNTDIGEYLEAMLSKSLVPYNSKSYQLKHLGGGEDLFSFVFSYNLGDSPPNTYLQKICKDASTKFNKLFQANVYSPGSTLTFYYKTNPFLAADLARQRETSCGTIAPILD